jgi:hypothetical protein
VVPDNLRYGGGVSQTLLNPGVAVIIVVAGILLCVLPRRRAIIPFLLTAILLPADQVLVIAGLHFPLLRILILFGMVRIAMTKGQGQKVLSGGVNGIDVAFLSLSLTTTVAGVLLFHNSEAFIYQMGQLYTAFGAYFLLRCLIRDGEDVVRAIRTLAVIVVLLAGVMVVEQVTRGWNPYALLGGARSAFYAHELIREGRVRSMGSFSQPLLAGWFAAATIPLFIGLWITNKNYRGSAVFGILGATVMMFATHSSTSTISYMAGLLAFCFWVFRNQLRLIRWGTVAVLVGLNMVMKAPVWHLLARVDVAGGSTSWQRYDLIQTCVTHFWNWWLVGTNLNSRWGWSMWDTTNQYVATAYSGGLLGLIFLIAVLVYGFKYVGRARKAATDKKQALFFWALGSALFSSAIGFIGVSLWDQSIVGWYALLTCICAAVPVAIRARVPQTESPLPYTNVLRRPSWSSRQHV